MEAFHQNVDKSPQGVYRGLMARERLTQKQETFCQEYFATRNATQSAITAGYSLKTADVIGYENLAKPQIIERMAELNALVVKGAVAGKQERLEIATEIARGRLSDFVRVSDGGSSHVTVGLEDCNSAAIAGIETRTEFGKEGESPEIITKLKLHDPLKAIDLLNKMDHIYEPGGERPIVNVVFVIGKGYRERKD